MINTIIEKIKKREPLTDAEKMTFINYSITTPSKAGKMDQIPSISTSALCSVGCAMRSKNSNYICSRCYARRELKRRKTLREKMYINNIFYTQYELTAACVPYINSNLFRFEGFGEIQNIIQVKNYFTIARKNKHCFFVLWTKEPQIIQEAMAAYNTRKPSNMRIIVSEYIINAPEKKRISWTFADKVFSVYTKDHANKNDININCAGKCIDCMRCYDKANKEKYINGIIK